MTQDVVQFQSKALVPSSITQAMDLAKMMADSTLVPVALQKKPADCLLVIEQSMRWGMSPFAVAQSTSVIKGKLMYEGKLVAAVVNANGGLDRRLSYVYEGEGATRKIIVSGRVKGEEEDRTVEVKFSDVKTDNEQWRKQPDQQLMYSGARVWARRHMPELMLGVYTPDEDIEDKRAQPAAGVPISSVAIEPVEVIDAETGEVSPHLIAVQPTADGKGSDWMEWGKNYSVALRSSKSKEEFEEWIKANAASMNGASKDAPQIHGRICEIIAESRTKLEAA